MQSCQNPNCPNPFNPDGNKFCQSCGSNGLSELFRHRYRVIRLLGAGGFGKTYLAQDADRLDDTCVIKQFAPQVAGTASLNKATDLFKQEARQLYELGENHQQIPRLIAYFEHGKSLYLVQEFIQGQTLLAQLQEKPFTEQQIKELLTDLLPVLSFIHSRNVIHRDIKPENIIRRETDGKFVLIDFGGAKQITQTSLARQGTGIFTVGYAPTEQTAGKAVPASDLYALGATCARLLTQCLPVMNDYGDIDDKLYDAMNGEWLWREYLKEKGITVSNPLAEVLDKLLQHLPRDRYQSALDVLKDLNAAQPTPSPVPPPTQESNVGRVPTSSISPSQPSNAGGVPTSSTSPLKTFVFPVVMLDARGNIDKHQRYQAEYFAEYFPEDLGNGIILELVKIPGGEFVMGSPDTEIGRSDSESPLHKVKISPFFIGKFSVTQAQWGAVAALPKVKYLLNPNPSDFKGANKPVEKVSWEDAEEFCARLWRETGREYRLPSEAEWEYACRAGTTTPFHFGKTITSNLANYDARHSYGAGSRGNFRRGTTIVGTFQAANRFGLYDMHGNVGEWCADAWHDNYNGAPSDGSVWEFKGNNPSRLRVLRRGSWYNHPANCRSACREKSGLLYKDNSVGFRVAVSNILRRGV